MSNDAKNGNAYERLWKLQTKIGMMVMDRVRGVDELVAHLQKVVDDPNSEFISMDSLTGMFPTWYNFGVLIVPDDYDSQTQLKKFWEGTPETPAPNGHTELLTEENFPAPSEVLKPGDRLEVSAHVVRDYATAACLAFLKRSEGLLVGAQGLALFWQQMLRQINLERSLSFYSFDEKEKLLSFPNGSRGVPSIHFYGSSVLHCVGTTQMWDEIPSVRIEEIKLILLFKKIPVQLGTAPGGA